MHPTDDYVRRLLSGIASGRPVSQRSLAKDLGVALGLANILIRRVAKRGWVRIVRTKPNRVLYSITPAGIAEMARTSREYLRRNVGLYVETRERIRERLAQLPAAASGAVPRVAFFGAGEVAELAYVVIGEIGLDLVGVVDDERTRPFFGVPVYTSNALNGERLAAERYDALVVMSFDDPQEIRDRLQALGVPDEKVHWLAESPVAAAGARRPRSRLKPGLPAAVSE